MIDTKAIRNKILDLAVRGKLTEQLSEDGTAEELFRQIQAEKQALIKAGKIKKEKPLPEINEEDIPFDIPSSWEWVRIIDIAYLTSGNQYPELECGIPYVKVADMNLPENQQEITTSSRYTNNENIGIIPISSIIFPKRGGAILTNKKRLVIRCPIYIDSNTMAMTVYSSDILLFIKWWFESINLGDLYTGTSIPQVNNKDIYPMIVPLPPLAEQKRIVEKIEQAFSVLDIIDELQKKYADNMTVLKSKLIDLAIRGKLTEQLPEDGTAEELYQQIQAEREKQEKAGIIKTVELLPETEELDDSFTIPSNWKWTTLGNVSFIVRGGSPRPIKEYITTREDGINWIKIGDVEKGGKYIYSTHEKIIPAGESKSRRVYPGDFLLTNSMSFGRPYISKIEGCIHDGWLLIHNLFGFDSDYLYYLLSSSYMCAQFTDKASGSTVENLNIDKVKAAIIPLPPLAEQKRIVEKLDEIFKFIES
ncbi:MAG TPA: hypothetical protein DHH42_06485 [Clostridiales bacterium]|nr:hypothetical protein [Clostridiales bacterium]